MPIFYKMIAYSYVLLTHKSVEAANFKPWSKMCKQNALLCIILYIFISMQAGILCPYVWFCAWINPKRYIIGGTYCIFFIYVWAYLSLEEALGVDIYYFIDTQLIVLFAFNFKIVVTYCIFLWVYLYIWCLPCFVGIWRLSWGGML